jgi:hypothetical protein
MPPVCEVNPVHELIFSRDADELVNQVVLSVGFHVRGCDEVVLHERRGVASMEQPTDASTPLRCAAPPGCSAALLPM